MPSIHGAWNERFKRYRPLCIFTDTGTTHIHRLFSWSFPESSWIENVFNFFFSLTPSLLPFPLLFLSPVPFFLKTFLLFVCPFPSLSQISSRDGGRFKTKVSTSSWSFLIKVSIASLAHFLLKSTCKFTMFATKCVRNVHLTTFQNNYMTDMEKHLETTYPLAF